MKQSLARIVSVEFWNSSNGDLELHRFGSPRVFGLFCASFPDFRVNRIVGSSTEYESALLKLESRRKARVAFAVKGAYPRAAKV